jgi:hypothetical protein
MGPALLESNAFLILCAAVVVVAGLAVVNTVVASIWWRAGKDIGSILEFKYLHPLEIRPEGRYPFLLFISSLPTGTPTPNQAPDVVEVTIQRQIERLLQENRPHYRESNTTSNRPIPKNKYLRFKFKAQGLRFDPQETTRLHNEELVIQHFEVIAGESLEGTTVRGVLEVSVGWFAVAELGFEIRVTSKAVCEPFQATSGPTHRDIFPSYAREDAAYLEEFERYFKVFGDEYLSDVKKIRAGTEWPTEITSLITQADVFQLFWSHNAAKSDYIPKELEYALALKRPNFIYQTTWESDSPPVPATAGHIQSTYVSFERKKQKKSSSRRAFTFAPLLAATGASANAAVPVLATAAGVLVLSVGIGLGTRWGLERAKGPGPGPGPDPIASPSVEQPSPSPTPNRDTPPPPSAPVTGQVLANNEGVRGLEVMLCAQGQTPALKPKCTSTKTDSSGSFSFSTVDKALKYYVVVQSKDWTCDPPRQALSDVNVPQNVRFVCKKTETPSPPPSPTAPPAAQADIRVDAKLDHEPKKQGERARVTITTQLPEYVVPRTSKPDAKRSQTQSGHLLLQQFLSSVAAGQEQQLTIDIFLTRDLKENERVWIERWPPKYDK